LVSRICNLEFLELEVQVSTGNLQTQPLEVHQQIL